MAGLDIKVDTTEFEKTFREYMKVTSRSMPEAINQHAFYIARNAVVDTKAATKEEIARDLRASSKEYAGVPLAAILVNVARGKAGKKGLSGEKMTRAVETFIKKKAASRNFLRSGWLPAVKLLATMVKRKSGAKPMPAGVKQKGKPKGGVRPARVSYSFKPVATLWNSVFGGLKKNSRVKQLIQEGAQQAVNEEVDSMREYIKQKLADANQKVGWQK